MVATYTLTINIPEFVSCSLFLIHHTHYHQNEDAHCYCWDYKIVCSNSFINLLLHLFLLLLYLLLLYLLLLPRN